MFKQFLQKNLIWIVLAIVLIGGAFFLFAEIADDVFEKEKFQIDQMASQFVSSIQSDTLDSIFGFITELGAVWLIATGSIIVGIILLFYPSNRLWRVLYFAVTMIGISVLTSSLKELFERDRPNLIQEYDGTGYSFPSGHSTGPMVFYGFIIYLIIRSRFPLVAKWIVGIVLGLLIFLIGFSRIYLGVHYASDVIGGFLLGFAWLATNIAILEITIRKNT
ncbi:phosphatase PAP2 family protein [Allobacillus halotolerans]|uniref:Phosphatase PAP2 family protein n=1 Tax=Allobacillus halotolerans TaxID=570278 RepID=A0ABS6GQF2_9BACI|nr:phosphatase PAP2 family protein [Allobacillus halotolerans]MBU6080885.1 phosphatase PAP2 family protein [Allobacillus halotolerans]